MGKVDITYYDNLNSSFNRLLGIDPNKRSERVVYSAGFGFALSVSDTAEYIRELIQFVLRAGEDIEDTAYDDHHIKAFTLIEMYLPRDKALASRKFIAAIDYLINCKREESPDVLPLFLNRFDAVFERNITDVRKLKKLRYAVNKLNKRKGL